MTEQDVPRQGVSNHYTEYLTYLSDPGLLNRYQETLGQAAQYTAMAGRIEQEILRRMAERGAIAIPSDHFFCELKVADTYSQSAFTPLKEVFSEAELKTCFTPAHEETVQVADKWTTAKVKALARRYGAEALAIVEQARIPGAPRLRFERIVPVDQEADIRHVRP